MKMLDLGCHDGWIGRWLLERFDGDLTIDGIELHPDACESARARGYRQVVQAVAEDAPDHFDEGTYDAVVLFELIEHVPDMDRLLSVAERMLAPGGRVYVSTPDGTFGQGNNPHHLRALRALDLADQLRRRGSIEQMTVGPDTITVAAYTPVDRRGEIAIFAGPALAPWAPYDIEMRGLGGSETAAVRLAEHLAELGYVVTVYGDLTDEGCASNVMYRQWTAFDPAEPRLGVISSRMPEAFERPINAQTKLLWLHDVDCGPRLTPQLAAEMDRVLVLSEWHERHVAGVYPFLAGRSEGDGIAPSSAYKLARIRNGIHLEYFQGDLPESIGDPPLDTASRHPRVVYTSSPDRGLDILLELWPEIRERVPDAELAYAYSPVYWQVAEQRDDLKAHTARIRELSKHPGVHALGALTQPQVATLMRSSMVWAHPSWCTPAEGPFHETSCIGAMEAQAAGCLVVASGWGALPETVQVGRLVGDGAPGAKWRSQLVEHIVEGLTDVKVQRWAQRAGPKAAAELGWRPVAEQIAGLLEGEVIASSEVTLAKLAATPNATVELSDDQAAQVAALEAE